MNKEELKSVWATTQIIKERNSIFSIELYEDIANYTVQDTILNIEFLSDSYYLQEEGIVDHIFDSIRKNIIAQALDEEYGIKTFTLNFNGKMLNKAAI